MGRAKTKEQLVRRLFAVIEEVRRGKPLIACLDELPMSSRTFYDLIEEDESLKQEYTHALNERSSRIFEDLFKIADKEDDDLYIDEKGVERVNNDVIMRDKLRIDTRRWALSKMQPKKYGDKLDIDAKHSGEIKINISKEDEDLGI